jgi:hypothetical protein
LLHRWLTRLSARQTDSSFARDDARAAQEAQEAGETEAAADAQGQTRQQWARDAASVGLQEARGAREVREAALQRVTREAAAAAKASAEAREAAAEAASSALLDEPYQPGPVDWGPWDSSVTTVESVRNIREEWVGTLDQSSGANSADASTSTGSRTRQ